jgi:hypothetical protein
MEETLKYNIWYVKQKKGEWNGYLLSPFNQKDFVKLFFRS